MEKREKIDAVLRNGIFVGYRMHTGGVWTNQYQVIDAEAYEEILGGSGRTAYVHSVSEIYIPGSSGDDNDKHPTFPVAEGTFREKQPSDSEIAITTAAERPETAESLEELRTDISETLPSSERPVDNLPDDLDPAPNAGGVDGEDTNGEATTGNRSAVTNQDCWSLEGDYLVRRHLKPRTTLFSPLDVPDDPPPIEAKFIEVLRTTKPLFSGHQWPEMETIEDCWTGRSQSDAKSLRNPVDDSTLTWTGETIFERVLPKPPKGKAWCGHELVRTRAGSKRALDVHPLHWWLMSTTARLKASDEWKTKCKDIRMAQNRRTIPREELDKMPQPAAALLVQSLDHRETDAAIMFVKTEYPPDITDESDDDDSPPDLVDESSDEEFHTVDTESNCSDDIENFLTARYDEEKQSSDGESAENVSNPEVLQCHVCLKPQWDSKCNPRHHHCRDHSMHAHNQINNDHDDAPILKKTVDKPLHACAMLPDEMSDIADKYKQHAEMRTTTTGDDHSQHREKEASMGDQLDPLIAWYSLVAKPIPRKMWANMPRAQAAVDAERQKLRDADGGRGTWDESVVRNYWDIQKEAKEKLDRTGVHTHFGTLFDLCVEKGSELEESKRRYKGRVVFGGHRIHDEYGLAAEFPEQGSGASFLSASKLCDATALLPGCSGEQSDATSAYTQSKLGTGMKGPYIVTWVELPRSMWRPEWVKSGMTRPCCQLRLSLYGHPMSGKYWENHFTSKLLNAGFVPMKGWECLFTHPELKLILSVYVDDFKLVGKSQNLEKGWKLITGSGLVLDPPTPLGDYLGCGQFPIHIPPEEARRRLENVHPLMQDIEGFSEVKTGMPVRAIRYNMFGFFRQCVEVYCELAKIDVNTLKKVATPSLDDHQLNPEDFEQEGHLMKDAAKITMKALYGARLVRYELLWPICSSARLVTKWTRACDKRLHRLMCYIHQTYDHTLESFVGDAPELCHPVLFSDADFAGDMITAKSTSGTYVAIVGPNTFAPIAAGCNKQTCVSHSSTESEIVAAERGIRTEGLQVLTFWEHVVELLSDKPPAKLAETPGTPKAVEFNPYSEQFNPGKYFAYTRKSNHKTCLIIAEDNEAVIKIIKKARSVALRHLPRTHRIDVHWLFEVCSHPRVRMVYVNTKQQVADLMTKALNKPEVWHHLLDIAQIRPGIMHPTEKSSKIPTAAVIMPKGPPGLSMPINAAECSLCSFNITVDGATCPCHWD